MESHLIEFNNIEWVEAGEGIRFKLFSKDGKTIRLMELSDTYSDLDWCIDGHFSYIIEGEFKVKFENHSETFKAGDMCFITAGTKHIAMVEKGHHLNMISIEL